MRTTREAVAVDPAAVPEPARRPTMLRSLDLVRRNPRPLAPMPTRPASPPAAADSARLRRIEAALAELRPRFRRDGGDCELVAVDGSTVFVKLTGACSDCQLASVTVGGIQARLMELLRAPVRVVPVAPNTP